MSFAVHKATYYWCDCGQPLTAADAVPGMADGVADQTPSGPVPRPAEEPATPVPTAAEVETADEVETEQPVLHERAAEAKRA
jgi:hypothetical protein